MREASHLSLRRAESLDQVLLYLPSILQVRKEEEMKKGGRTLPSMPSALFLSFALYVARTSSQQFLPLSRHSSRSRECAETIDDRPELTLNAPSPSTLSSTFASPTSSVLTSVSSLLRFQSGSLTEPIASQEYYRGGSVFVPLTSGQEDVLLMPGLQGGDSVESSWSFEVSLSVFFPYASQQLIRSRI